MKSFESVLIAAAVLISSLSIGGMMGGFGHSMQGTMDGDCGLYSCPVSGNGMQVAECVGHCLGVATTASTASSLGMVLAFVVAVLLAGSTGGRSAPTRSFARLDAFIGKFLLHQRLSTVVLRN